MITSGAVGGPTVEADSKEPVITSGAVGGPTVGVDSKEPVITSGAVGGAGRRSGNTP